MENMDDDENSNSEDFKNDDECHSETAYHGAAHANSNSDNISFFHRRIAEDHRLYEPLLYELANKNKHDIDRLNEALELRIKY